MQISDPIPIQDAPVKLTASGIVKLGPEYLQKHPASDLGSFLWWRPEAGFVELDCYRFPKDTDPERMLVPRFNAGGVEILKLNRFETPIYLKFAELTGDLESVLEFYRCYGPLDFPIPLIPTDPIAAESIDVRIESLPRATSEEYVSGFYKVCVGESWEKVKHQHRLMSSGVELYRIIQNRDEEGLSEWCDRYQIASYEPKDEPEAEWTRLWRRFLYIMNLELMESVSTQIRPEPIGESTSLHTAPDNLHGFLWLQFASAIANQSVLKPCEVCGSAMEIGPDKRKARRRYCSNACKMKARYAEQRKAKS